MKATTIFLLAASVALGSAQVTINPDGSFACTNLNAAYCASASLESNIIIRCTNGTGHAGNCNDNLAGYPPLGVNFSPCWQSSSTSGDAACSKNGIVYPGSGSEAIWNTTAPFPIPLASNGTANSTATANATLTTVTLTSTRTNTLFTTVTSYVSGNGTASSGHWTTYTTPVMASTSLVTDSPISASTSTSTSTATIYSTIVSAQSSVDYTTIYTTASTTICPESSASPISASGPVFSIPMNTTTLAVGPGPVSFSYRPTASASAGYPSYAWSYSYSPAKPSASTASSVASAVTAGWNATVVGPSASPTGPMTYTGAATARLDTVPNGFVVVVFGLVVLALL